MVQASLRPSELENTTCVRITCINCGKLLFRLCRIGLLPDKETRVIEIKCYNRECKKLNIIKL